MTPNQLKRLYKGNISHAARELGMSRRVIYKWLKAKSIPARTQSWIEDCTGGALKAAK